jgi:hypothetical protein
MSKRSRSGATSEPFWVTWSPTTGAAPRAADGWPNGWRDAPAPLAVDLQVRLSPTAAFPLDTVPMCSHRSPGRFWVSVTCSARRRPDDAPGIAHLAADLAVERRLVDDDRDHRLPRPRLSHHRRRPPAPTMTPSARSVS